jgi:hypothetical protein
MKWASCVHSHAMFSGRRLSMPALAGSRCTSWSWRSSRWRSENGLDSHQLGEMDSTSSRLDGRRRVPLARPRQGRVSVVRPRLLLTGALLSAALACHRSRPPGFDPDCGPVDVATGVRLDHLATHVDSQLLSKQLGTLVVRLWGRDSVSPPLDSVVVEADPDRGHYALHRDPGAGHGSYSRILPGGWIVVHAYVAKLGYWGRRESALIRPGFADTLELYLAPRKSRLCEIV